VSIDTGTTPKQTRRRRVELESPWNFINCHTDLCPPSCQSSSRLSHPIFPSRRRELLHEKEQRAKGVPPSFRPAGGLIDVELACSPRAPSEVFKWPEGLLPPVVLYYKSEKTNAAAIPAISTSRRKRQTLFL
jgi:hypothetical protein